MRCRWFLPLVYLLTKDLQGHEQIPTRLTDILHPPDCIYCQVQTSHDSLSEHIHNPLLRFLALKVFHIPQLVKR